MSRFNDRIRKLQRRRGPQGGGVVTELSAGGYRYQGREYEALEDLPHGGGVLVIPQTLPPERWDPLALEVHENQENLWSKKNDHQK
jgi:hypothetical protein